MNADAIREYCLKKKGKITADRTGDEEIGKAKAPAGVAAGGRAEA